MKRKKYLCYNGKKEEFQLDKNKYGQPFMSVQNFLIYSDTAIMPKYVDGRVSSEGSLVKLKRQQVRKANRQEIREQVQNLYTWGLKPSLKHDLFVGKHGAVVCLIEDEVKDIEDLKEQNSQIQELINLGYELELGPGFDIRKESGKVKPRNEIHQKSQNRAIYCTNFKKFLSLDMDNQQDIEELSDHHMNELVEYSQYLPNDQENEEETTKKRR